MTWEELYAENERLRAKYDAANLRVSVLERAVKEANAAKHAANNRCHAVVGVCEKAVGWLEARGVLGAKALREGLDTALKTIDAKDPVASDG